MGKVVREGNCPRHRRRGPQRDGEKTLLIVVGKDVFAFIGRKTKETCKVIMVRTKCDQFDFAEPQTGLGEAFGERIGGRLTSSPLYPAQPLLLDDNLKSAIARQGDCSVMTSMVYA